MLRRVFFDAAGNGGGGSAASGGAADPAATLIDEVSKLSANTEKVLSEVEVVKTGFKKDLADLTEEVKTLKARGDGIDYKKLGAEVFKIQDAQQAEQVKSGVLFPGESRALESIPDPWSGEQNYLDDFDMKHMITERGFEGLDVVARMPVQSDAHRNFAKMGVDAAILDQCLSAKYMFKGKAYPGLAKSAPKFAKKWGAVIDRFVSDVTGKAASDLMDTTDMANWVPTQMSSEMRALIMLKQRVAALFQRVPMPTATYPLPVDMSSNIGFLAPETSSVPSAWGVADRINKFTPTKPTLTSRKLGGRKVLSGELNEDSVIPMLPYIRNSLVEIAAKNEEMALINGQRTATIDTGDAPGSTDVRYAWDGFRYYIEQFTGAKINSAGTITGTQLVSTMRKAMGELGVDDFRLAHIPSANAYLDMIGIDDVRTADMLGPNATLFRGQLAAIGNAPVVPSRYVRTDLNASGIYDGVTETKTESLLVQLDSWIIGDRRKITIEAERHASDDAWELVMFQRLAMVYLYSTSYNAAVALYNITS